MRKTHNKLFKILCLSLLMLTSTSNALADKTPTLKAAASSLQIYNYLKPQQQTAVLGYLAKHHLQESDVIPFYYSHHPYAIFANTFAAKEHVNKGQGYLIDNSYWPSTEHYYQAMKFPGNSQYQEKIRQARNGGQAAKMGRANLPGKDRQWNQHKKQIMYHALTAKFTQDSKANKTLLGTDDKTLIEAAAGSTNFAPDYTWGIGADGSGRNWLGELLMQVREDLS